MTTHTHQHFDHDVEAKTTNWLGWTKSILLLGLGLDLVFLIVTGTLTYYISPHFAWLTHLAAGLLIFFGVLSVVDHLRGTDHHHHEHDHDHDHDHHHDHHDHHHEEISWSILVVIAIPLILGLLVPAEPLSADSVNGGITMNSVGVSSEDLAAIPPVERDVLQWLRLFDTSDDPAVFNGQQVDVIGFVYNEPTFGDDRAMVVRFTISCCVADALAIGLPIDVTGLEVPAQGTWVRITGTLTADTFRDETMPIVQPDAIEEIEMPDDPYLYS